MGGCSLESCDCQRGEGSGFHSSSACVHLDMHLRFTTLSAVAPHTSMSSPVILSCCYRYPGEVALGHGHKGDSNAPSIAKFCFYKCILLPEASATS